VTAIPNIDSRLALVASESILPDLIMCGVGIIGL